MGNRSLLTAIKSSVIGALILVMALGGTVAISPRYVFWGGSDFDCCTDATAGYDWLGIFVVVPFVIAVALAMAVFKSRLDDRAIKITHRLL